ncbi:proteasome accessory factor PafA2 family protein [Nitrospira defluvii]|nr:proteasome accessory factor PafA2 family protein [Nitrospira defluvii]
MKHSRLFGIETEYGCLIHTQQKDISPEQIAHQVKDYLFRTREVGLLDLHHRAHDEPPGNGGFLLNGGRIYIDMGHIEYASPECTRLSEIVAFDRAGDLLLQQALEEMNLKEDVSFIKNNIDYETGATFGSHENYLVSRDFPFTEEGLGHLVPFLLTRQIFSGAGRIGANFVPQGYILLGDTEFPTIPFQISQRADHIVSDFYQWVQFSRAIINTRDEPLADPSRYRRIHLLLGDSNLSEYATALKIGTTALVLDLIHEGLAPNFTIENPVETLKEISRDPTRQWKFKLEDGTQTSALKIQQDYLFAAKKYFSGQDEDTNWTLQAWEETLNDLDGHFENLVGRIDWASKLWLFENFIKEENIEWEDPWLKSLDIEYHNINPDRGLYFGLEGEEKTVRLTTTDSIRQAIEMPPMETRAAGRGLLIRKLLKEKLPYLINWTSFYVENEDLMMIDPFSTYIKEAKQFLRAPKPPSLDSP